MGHDSICSSSIIAVAVQVDWRPHMALAEIRSETLSIRLLLLNNAVASQYFLHHLAQSIGILS